jgi:hypothetical protein
VSLKADNRGAKEVMMLNKYDYYQNLPEYEPFSLIAEQF